MKPDIHKASLSRLSRLFASLKPPGNSARAGFYRGVFIGPWWMRASGPIFVGVTGLPGWQGKKFLDHDVAVNVLKRKGELCEGPRMRWTSGTSRLDGKPGVGLQYPPNAPRPWRWITDELRELESGTLLGMSVLDAPVLRRIGIPFLLVREP